MTNSAEMTITRKPNSASLKRKALPESSFCLPALPPCFGYFDLFKPASPAAKLKDQTACFPADLAAYGTGF